MTISNSGRTAGPFIGNGITKDFPFSYKVFTRADVLVAQTNTATGVETLKTIDADYTVTLNADQDSNPGGIIRMVVAPPAGTTLAATSNISLVQSLDLTNQGGFYPKVINDALDRIVINIQQLAAKVGHGLSIGSAAITEAALAALALVQQIGGAAGAGLIGFLQVGIGAVVRTVLDRMLDTVSVKDFGAKGDGIADDTAAIQAAAEHCLRKRRKLYFPAGTYLTGAIVLNNSKADKWPTLIWEGEGFATGQALIQNGLSNNGTVIVTNGTNGLMVNLDSFWNESIRVRNMSFFNKGDRGFSCAILIDKTAANYPRGWEFDQIGYHNFDSCLVIRGNNPGINENFIGTMVVRKNFPYDCGVGIQLIDCYPNLMLLQNSLYHGCNKGGLVFAAGAQGGSGGIVTMRDTHFEGCEPAAVTAGAYQTILNLDSVSAEACGVVSGYGFIKRHPTSINSLTLNVSNSGYGDKGFSLMPKEFRLGRGSVINASCPVNASGYGWITNTPHMVTPVISNNAAYNQADTSTFCMAPTSTNFGRAGKRCFEKFAGWNGAGNINYTPPMSGELPDALRSQVVGTKSAGNAPIYNVSDIFVAPDNGHVYASWLASYSSLDNGLAPGSSVVVAGAETAVLGNTFSPYTGNFLYMAAIKTGQQLGRTSLITYGVPAYQSAAYVSFETKRLTMAEAACGHPRVSTSTVDVATAWFATIADYGDGATPYALRLRLIFDGGKYGFAEYVISGDGVLSSKRVVTPVASAVVTGIAVTVNGGLNTALYDIRVDNSSGKTVTITRQVEYLS